MNKADLELFKNKTVRRWFWENYLDERSALPHLVRYIEHHREETKDAALRSGDTEFLKGEVSGVDWVLKLFRALATDTETETAQADTETETVSGE